MAQTAKRSFWMHQIAEYIIAAALVASGLQSPTPVVPSMLGALVLLNGATSRGPLSAFGIFARRWHRLIDIVLVLVILAAAVQPWFAIDGGTRGIMALLAGALAVIWWQSDFSDPRAKQSRPGAAGASAFQAGAADVDEGGRADAFGRAAGRMAGKGVNAYRARKRR